MGMDDTCERLLRAGSLRCFVPDFFPSHTPYSSYHMYLQFPAGLSKVRYEQEAWRWCQASVNGLRVRGLNFIKDLLPFSKLSMFLKGVNTPQPLIDICKDMIKALMKIGSITKGYNHAASAIKLKSISLSARSSAMLDPDSLAEAAQEAATIAENEVNIMKNSNETIESIALT